MWFGAFPGACGLGRAQPQRIAQSMLVYDFTVAPLRLKTRLGGGRASAEGHWRARGRLAVFTVNLNCRQPLALGGEA